MEIKELIKVVVLVFIYGIATPVLGVLIRGRSKWQSIVFTGMCFMTISGFLNPGEWGLTLGFDEQYRGHARGFHFYFIDVLAGALVIARFMEAPRRFRWLPPGMLIYIIYIGLSFISVVNAPRPVYAFMALVKVAQGMLVFMAACNYFRGEDEVRVFLGGFALTMLWQLFVVLKLKYVDHRYQISGTFEHQNALAMYANMIGMVFLAAAAGPRQPGSRIYALAFLACAWVLECTLSRGGLGVFAIAVCGVMLCSIIDRMTTRRLMVLGAVMVVGCLGIVLSVDTIVGRFNDPYNRDSNLTRSMLNEASRDMAHDYPLGIGWNNFGVMINPPYRYGDIIDDYMRRSGEFTEVDKNKGIVESHYYLLLSETGYQGLISYLLMIGLFLYFNLRAAIHFRTQFLGALSIGIAMGCMSSYLQSFLERILTQPRNMMLWMILLALTSRIEIWRRDSKRNQKRASARVGVKSCAAR